MKDQETLSDLARAKVLFQQRTLEMMLRETLRQSKPDQERENPT